MDYLPEDIDGMMIFKIKCLPKDWFERTHDLRYFRMHSSKKKCLIRMGKIERCIDILCCSFNKHTFKVLTRGKRNTSNFQSIEGYKICFSYGKFSNRQWCEVSKVLIVYHLGMHMCLSKTNKKKYKRLAREDVV